MPPDIYSRFAIQPVINAVGYAALEIESGLPPEGMSVRDLLLALRQRPRNILLADQRSCHPSVNHDPQSAPAKATETDKGFRFDAELAITHARKQDRSCDRFEGAPR